jgi:hypothetical protein
MDLSRMIFGRGPFLNFRDVILRLKTYGLNTKITFKVRRATNEV